MAVKQQPSVDHDSYAPSFLRFIEQLPVNLAASRLQSLTPGVTAVSDRGRTYIDGYTDLTDQGLSFVRCLKTDADHRVKR